MILSFNPVVTAHENCICAGRPPGKKELEAIQKADAVILPQGCSLALYEMARANCPFVFPNYEARFRFSGKLGQIRLFEENKLRHPKTFCFENVQSCTGMLDNESILPDFPLVFKFSWGGEGSGVRLLHNEQDLKQALEYARVSEMSGQKGFMLQPYIPHRNRCLRAVIMGQKTITYWRVGQTGSFGTSMAQGAALDFESDPHLQEAARHAARELKTKTGINLAGIDYLFDENKDKDVPLVLEINYFFGRKGLGGSYAYYELLVSCVKNWLQSCGLDSGIPESN